MIDIDDSARDYFSKLIAQQGVAGLGIRLLAVKPGTPAGDCRLEFCETAEARESILKEHMARFAGLEKDRQAVLVYGGFHRSGIQKILKELDISYVVLSPKITQISGKHETLYRQLMQQGLILLRQILDLDILI